MNIVRASPTMRRSLGTVLLGAILAAMALSWAPDADAGAPLVIAALHVVEQQYVDPVQAVALLNAAIATLRGATHLDSHTLPDIAPGTPERRAAAQFSVEFSRAADTGVMPETSLAYLTTDGMLASLHDSHTYFLTPQQLRAERSQLFGHPIFSGIGVTVAQRTDKAGTKWLFVEDVLPGSPAEAAGIRRFDRIVQVDGKSPTNLDVAAVSRLLRGPARSTVSLVVQRGNQTLHISATRAPIRVPPVEARWLRPGVAYAKISEFSQGSGGELRRGLEQLAAQAPIRSVVLDLRGNPGGLITEAASVSGVFLPSGTVLAHIQERGQQQTTLRSTGTPLFVTTPMVVLVDGQSASASEILSGAFKDDHRATVVGEKTAGALGGAVTVSLPQGGMSITVDRIVTPKYQRVEAVGIAPDVRVALTVADMEQGQDSQLQAALHTLQQARSRPPAAVPGVR